MGDSAAKKANKAQQQKTIQLTSDMVNNQAFKPSPLSGKINSFSDSAMKNYGGAVDTGVNDYDRIMHGNLNPDTGERSGVSYDSLGSDYENLARTGGYSADDIQNLRARGMSPITSAYSSTMRNLDRAKAIGGSGGAANYIAASSKAQRELPQQLSDAEQAVNADLAGRIQAGKMAGLQGQGQVLSGKNSLYGTTPGMASLFGNEAINSLGLGEEDLNNNNQYGLNLIGTNLGALNPNLNKETPWWQKLLGAAGSVAGDVAGLATGFKGNPSMGRG